MTTKKKTMKAKKNCKAMTAKKYYYGKNYDQDYYITLKLGSPIGAFLKCKLLMSSTNHLLFSPFSAHSVHFSFS